MPISALLSSSCSQVWYASSSAWVIMGEKPSHSSASCANSPGHQISIFGTNPPMTNTILQGKEQGYIIPTYPLAGCRMLSECACPLLALLENPEGTSFSVGGSHCWINWQSCLPQYMDECNWLREDWKHVCRKDLFMLFVLCLCHRFLKCGHSSSYFEPCCASMVQNS